MKTQMLHIIAWREKKLFVAKFLELELASQGKTREEAVKNIMEALDLYLEDENINQLSFPSIEEVSTKVISVN